MSEDFRSGELDNARYEIEDRLGGLIADLKAEFQLWASQLPPGDDGEVVLVGNETELDKDGRHGSLPKHIERILPYSPVRPYGAALEFFGDDGGHQQALLQMGVLHQCHENVGLLVGRVETLVFGGIVVFEKNYGILALHHIHIICEQIPVLVRGLAQDMHRVAVGRCADAGVDVNGDEELTLGLVGYLGAVPQLDELVGGACHHDFDVRELFADFFGKG